jgi:hypothetical protein
VSIPGGEQKTKEMVQPILGQRIFKQPEFQSIGGNVDKAVGLLGGHSIRKFAAMHMHRCCMTKHKKDI